MRKGTNPLKYKPIPAMPKVVVSAITHLPNLQGYHAHRLEVVKVSLLSMREFSDAPVLVWDNGSCKELTEWLVNAFKPDYLILSPNVGKSSAMAGIFRMFPPETIIACADDDILYYPHWLDAQLELLQRYPAAVVSGYPVRYSFGKNNNYTLHWAEQYLETGKFIPDQWERDYATSIGASTPDVKTWHTRYGQKDYRINYNGMLAYATSQHCQFVTVVQYLNNIVAWDNFGSADENQLDERIDRAGLLRLTTVERYTRHMGNVLDQELNGQVFALGLGDVLMQKAKEAVYSKFYESVTTTAYTTYGATAYSFVGAQVI